jgi:hypothetical protein
MDSDSDSDVRQKNVSARMIHSAIGHLKRPSAAERTQPLIDLPESRAVHESTGSRGQARTLNTRYRDSAGSLRLGAVRSLRIIMFLRFQET